MNAAWNAAQALLALVTECLGENCGEYPRSFVTTSTPVADCDTIAVQIGNIVARSGSCVGRVQFPATLSIHVIRCCEPTGQLSAQGGYTPPSPEAIEEAVACITRDAWRILECVSCSACATLGAIKGVTACCDTETGPPAIRWGGADNCRYAIVEVPVIFTVCCPVE